MNYCISFFFLVASSIAFADTLSNQYLNVFNYDLFFDSKDIGDIRVALENRDDGTLRIIEGAAIKAPGFFNTINIRSTQVETFTKDGELLTAELKTMDGDYTFFHRAVAENNDLWVSYSKVRSSMSSSSSETKASPLSVCCSNRDYDISFSYLPFYWLDQQQSLPKSIKTFDVESLAVEAFSIEDLGVDTVQSKSTSITAKHYSLSQTNSKPLDIWLALNDQDIPYFVQMAGHDDGGSFRILLKPHTGK